MAVETLWSDIHQNIGLDGQGAIRLSKNIEAVETSIDNILRTHRGERLMLPSFGAGIETAVFDDIEETTFDVVASEIKAAIELWDDRVVLNSVDYKAQADQNKVTLILSFSVKGYYQVFEHSISLTGV